MNKQQIKAELRRSACEDKDQAYLVDDWAFYAALEFRKYGETALTQTKIDDCRTFFLLVAEAL